MPQNRNKLIDLLIGNISNAAVHKILEEAVDEEVLRNHYDKELLNSLETAKRYREKINPVKGAIPEKDIKDIKNKVIKKVTNELQTRISKGYENINLDLIEATVTKISDMQVTDD